MNALCPICRIGGSNRISKSDRIDHLQLITTPQNTDHQVNLRSSFQRPLNQQQSCDFYALDILGVRSLYTYFYGKESLQSKDEMGAMGRFAGDVR